MYNYIISLMFLIPCRLVMCEIRHPSSLSSGHNLHLSAFGTNLFLPQFVVSDGSLWFLDLKARSCFACVKLSFVKYMYFSNWKISLNKL